MHQSLPACPECGGPRELFKYTDGGSTAPAIILGFLNRAQIYACTCLNCGHITLRAAPQDMQAIRDAAQR
jgi:hypothetical protein